MIRLVSNRKFVLKITFVFLMYTFASFLNIPLSSTVSVLDELAPQEAFATSTSISPTPTPADDYGNNFTEAGIISVPSATVGNISYGGDFD